MGELLKIESGEIRVVMEYAEKIKISNKQIVVVLLDILNFPFSEYKMSYG